MHHKTYHSIYAYHQYGCLPDTGTTWEESGSDKALWIRGEGYADESGQEHYTLDGLKALLEPHFVLIDTQSIPFILRESARKFQHTISQMGAWRKR